MIDSFCQEIIFECLPIKFDNTRAIPVLRTKISHNLKDSKLTNWGHQLWPNLRLMLQVVFCLARFKRNAKGVTKQPNDTCGQSGGQIRNTISEIWQRLFIFFLFLPNTILILLNHLHWHYKAISANQARGIKSDCHLGKWL